MNEEDDFFYKSEVEARKDYSRILEIMTRKEMCFFCGIEYKKYGHEEWCKSNEKERLP